MRIESETVYPQPMRDAVVEADFRKLCLELVSQGPLSERFHILWAQCPVALIGEELDVICRLAAEGLEIMHGTYVSWYRFH